MRLIDADRLRFSQRYARADPDSDRMIALYAIDESMIDAAPTVDAVPVVRCRECKYSRDLNTREKEIFIDFCLACENNDASQHGYMIVFPGHFCSYGERIAGNDT